MKTLTIGEAVIVNVDSGEIWNPKADFISVEPGQRYEFEVPSGQTWFDCKNQSGADGYPSNSTFLIISERLRRFPSANWFTLIGTIGQTESTAFPIGSHLQGFALQASGALYVFANASSGCTGTTQDQ